MSEYQYYEFMAIDQPLSETQMAQLRAVSAGAVITPTSFVNQYNWGDLKADPMDWLRRYFDAFVYFANWCSCWLALRVPKAAFHQAELKPYAARDFLDIDANKEYWIFIWSLEESDDYDRFGMEDGSGWMQRLIPLREELLRGDLRPLYLGWLASVYTRQDDEQEPEVPPGLATLSPAQQALVEFLEIDIDLVTAAGAGSADFSSPTGEQPIDDWLESWSNDDMKTVLKHMVTGKEREVERRIKSNYAAWLQAQRSSPSPAKSRRTVAELHKLAEAAAVEREAREDREREKLAAEQRQHREAQLRQIMANASKHWEAADAEATRAVGPAYIQAVAILSELAEAYTLSSSRAAFDRELQRFLLPHGRRRTLLRRMVQAGLWVE